MSDFDFNSWLNGANWYNEAKALKRAHDKIREAYLVACRNLDVGKSVRASPGRIEVKVYATALDIDDLDQYPISMLLLGYAMENIFRGILICDKWLKDPESITVTDFADLTVSAHGTDLPLMKHGLRRLLAADGMNIRFSEEEKKMMDYLDKFITWAGRYATPKEIDPEDPSGIKAKLEPIKYPFQNLDSLYVKSIEKLEELCRLQGEKLSE
jgi:hypothetical protein